MPPEENIIGEGGPLIKRVRVQSITIYDITESELEILERDSSDISLNFAIFCLSWAISFLIALLTATLSDKARATFIGLIISGFILGVFFLVFFFKNYKSKSKVARDIRDRLPKEGGIPELSNMAGLPPTIKKE